MCHEWWSRREKRREERFDEGLRYLLDEERGRSEPTPVVEYEDKEPVEPERVRVESGSR